MKHLKKAAFTLLLAASAMGQAQTQTTTTIYGVLDAGIRSSEGLGVSATSSPSASPRSTTAMVSGVDRSGRFGFSGVEDLTGGYRALLVLETDLYLHTGSVNANTGTDKNAAAATANKLFDRQASLGLATPFGQILFGRQQGALRDVIDDIDAIDGRFTGFNPNLQYTSLNSPGLVTSTATYYGTGDAGNGSMMRQDNLVKYSVVLGPVALTAAQSLGGQAGSAQAGSSSEFAVKYLNGPLLLAAAYEDLHNSVLNAQNLPSDSLNLTATTVGGRLTLGDWQISSNFGSNRAENTVTTNIHTNIYSIGSTYAATPALDLTLGYYLVTRHWSANAKPDADIHRVIGFAEYKFSKKTLAYLELDWNRFGGDVTQFRGGLANRARTTGVTIGLNKKI